MNNNFREELDIFVGNKKHYFGPRFEIFMDQDSKVSWNWVTLFFPTSWMAYRKMYVQSIIYLIVTNVFSFTIGGTKTGSLVSFIIWLGFPVFANYIYYRHAQSKINQIDRSLDQATREDEIRRIGGTSVLSIFLFWVIGITLWAVLFFETGQYGILMEAIRDAQMSM